jgi:leucyl aminopeptidase
MTRMTTKAALTVEAETSAPVFLYTAEQWSEGVELPRGLAAAAKAQGFKAMSGQLVQTASDAGIPDGILFGLGDGKDGLALAALSARLMPGDYHLARDAGLPFAQLAAGWVDGAYRFDRYIKAESPPRLLIPEDQPAGPALIEAQAIQRLRDMVNTPAEDMGPVAIEAEIRTLAEAFGATLVCTEGEALLAGNYPMIHAVGRAGPQSPRLIELSWGDPKAPELAIVGKGVAFDTGGLNLKTGNYMRLMKKDMGGAAHAIALAELVMAAALPVHLKLYVPAVENAISGTAFRPGDVLSSRKGLSVEIDNTDAEGRLILGDALTRASETDPDLIIDFATLTGAARVALGPDLAPFYTDDDELAAAIEAGARASGDPVWRMPLWAPYLAGLKSPIADLVNSTSDGMAGSVTAALFLQKFVSAPRWVHLDVWAWRKAKYGRPEGGAACGLRAMWAMLQARYR